MLAFTECMRDHGVDMPDPQPAGDGGGRVITMEGEEMDRERFEEAQEACEPLMEEVVGEIERDPEREAEMREQMLEYAQCMRDHGIDMPDPTFSDDGRVEIGVGGDGSEIEAEEMDGANEACAGDDMFMAPPSRAGEAGEDGGDGRRAMRVWPMLGGAAVLVGAAGIAGVVVSGSSGDEGNDTDAPETTVERTLVEVTRTDLARTEELDGSIGHGESRPLVLTADGTLTGLPAAGDVIEPGGVVAEVDGRPIVALPGQMPLWRPLGPGVEDGADVLQLEYVLASLGYTEAHDVTVDDDWTAATTEAVEDFQEDHGQDDDGEISVGEVIFIDGPVRVDGVEGVVGQQAAEAGITITGTEQAVHVDLDVDDAELLTVGDTVDVELPTGDVVAGTVTTIDAAETDDQAGTTTLPVTLALADAPALPDGTPVEVHVEVAAADGVLAVPVEAVLALAEGGYAVELADGATTRLVGVTLGVFADGMVEITGDVAAGAEVVVP